MQPAVVLPVAGSAPVSKTIDARSSVLVTVPASRPSIQYGHMPSTCITPPTCSSLETNTTHDELDLKSWHYFLVTATMQDLKASLA